jgi:hypothetical protein
MPTTYAIPDGRTVMAATLYTGTNASLSINNASNGVSFQPNLVWIKGRSQTSNNVLQDSVRGVNRYVISNSANAEGSDGSLTAFNSNGFSLTTDAGVSFNANGTTYVAWQWNAGSSTVTNTAGSITSQVSANTAAGFSIVTYTGNNTTGATVGHGLGVAPQLILTKQTNAADSWNCYHVSLGNTAAIFLNQTAQATTASSFWNNTSPSSTVITFGNAGTNQNNNVAYCWAPVAGYSQFGSYTGNGSTDGPFVYTGFRPAFLMIKNISSGSNDWAIFCNTMMPYNVGINGLKPNKNEAEYSGYNYRDFLSNGFKFRNGDSDTNTNGSTYIYAAFAENPFKYANAR